jgi:hypothetical protein
MAKSFSIREVGVAWRTAIAGTGIYQVSAATWRTAKNIWMYEPTGGLWHLGFTTGSISGLAGTDVGGSPTDGLLDLTWSHSGYVTEFTITIDADLAGGTTYATNMWSGGDPTLDAKSLDFSGTPGFTTLGLVNIRMRLVWSGEIVTQLTENPPWPT